jgi:hypothetical protein
VVPAYLPQSAVVDRNYLILMAFTSSITLIASLPTLETPPCSPFPGNRPSLQGAIGAAKHHGRATSAFSPVAALLSGLLSQV